MSEVLKFLKLLPVLAFVALSVGCTTPWATGRYDFGPLACRDVAPDGSQRFRALGPVIERQTSASGSSFTAVRPFYSRVNDPANNRLLQEYLWPVGMRKDLGDEIESRYLLLFYHDFDTTKSDSRYRFLIFPVVFAGRDINGNGYFGIFPIGGKVNEFLSMDEISFVLFPLYMHSKVREVNTYDFLWPLISSSSGGSVDKFRVLPLYGRAVKGDEWVKETILWPIWTSARYNYPDDKGSSFVLFPLFGHSKLDSQETWMLVPPFLRWSKSTKATQVMCPWPFVQYDSGARDRLYLWPLWGSKQEGAIDTSFYLWPMGRYETIDRGREQLNWSMFFPFWFNEVRTIAKPQAAAVSGKPPVAPVDAAPDAAGGPEVDVTGRYFKLWPLFSCRSEDAESKFQIADLWPGKQLTPLERNWAPYWSLYTQVNGSAGSEQEFLWGMYRNQSNASGSHLSVFPLFSMDTFKGARAGSGWDVFCGLFGYRREGLQKTYRLLYFLEF